MCTLSDTTHQRAKIMHKNRNTIYLDICPGLCAFSVHYTVEYKGDNKNSLLLRAKWTR